MSNHASTQDIERRVKEYATGFFLCYGDLTWDIALCELEAAVDDDRKIGLGIQIWEPFEDNSLDQILGRIIDLADDMMRLLTPENESSNKRIVVVHENDTYQYSLANFDATNIEIVHLNFESEFQEPDDMVSVRMPSGKTQLAFGNIDRPEQESENSLKVDAVFDLVKHCRGL